MPIRWVAVAVLRVVQAFNSRFYLRYRKHDDGVFVITTKHIILILAVRNVHDSLISIPIFLAISLLIDFRSPDNIPSFPIFRKISAYRLFKSFCPVTFISLLMQLSLKLSPWGVFTGVILGGTTSLASCPSEYTSAKFFLLRQKGLWLR